MSKPIVLITGASRGLGAAIAQTADSIGAIVANTHIASHLTMGQRENSTACSK